MPTPTLRPIDFRMRRAAEVRQELETAINEYLQSQPYEIITSLSEAGSLDPDALALIPEALHDRIVKVAVGRVRTVKAIPDRISVLTADVLLSMRMALDYVAWQLALGTKAKPSDRTAFPIVASDDPDVYSRAEKRCLADVPESAHAAFRSLQPFHAGPDAKMQPLWILHRLANEAKHQQPDVLGSASIGSRIVSAKRVAGAGEEDFVGGRVGGPFAEGDAITVYGALGDRANPNHVEQAVLFDLAFARSAVLPEGAMLRNLIDALGNSVTQTIAAFAPHFPGSRRGSSTSPS